MNDLRRNLVLRALDKVERDRLMPNLKVEHSPIGHVMQQAGKPLSHVYFPLTSVHAVMAESEHGVGIEVGSIGAEGVIGLAGHLGAQISRHTVVCWCAGEAASAPLAEFIQVTAAPGLSRAAIDRFTDYLLIQTSQNVLCTSQHSVRARLARWLLAAHDRFDCQDFSSTQESLAQMLGVHRPTISEVAAQLQRDGLIAYRRGSITIADRVGLRQIACECYRIIDDALTAVRQAE